MTSIERRPPWNLRPFDRPYNAVAPLVLHAGRLEQRDGCRLNRRFGRAADPEPGTMALKKTPNPFLLGLVLLVVITLPVCVAYADVEAGGWTPQPRFRIENRSYEETLIFISGISYALSASHSQLKKAGQQDFFCTKDSHIGSQLLIDILNGQHTGSSITSEQAIETIVQGLKKRFPCN